MDGIGFFGSSGNGLEDELKAAATHEEEIGEALDEAIGKMENYESELYSEEEKDNIPARKAAENLKDILIDFEKTISNIEEEKENVRDEIDAVKKDLNKSGNVPEGYEDLEQRMENNLEVAEELLEFVEQEQERLDRILTKVMEDVEDGRESFALNKIEKVEEIDAHRLDEARQKFEQEWSQLLSTSS